MSHFGYDRRYLYVDAESTRLPEVQLGVATFDFEHVFRTEYTGITRLISRVLQDQSRAQDVATEVFWRLSRTPKAQGDNTSGWLYRTATRLALDELRKQLRREKYEQFFSFACQPRTPEDLYLENEEQRGVRRVLARLRKKDAELLILKSNDLSYEEIARALHLNPASVGTLLRRAEEAFRKEYVRENKL